MKVSIRNKLVGGFGVCVLLMMVIVGLLFASFHRIESLYFDSIRRTEHVIVAGSAAHLGDDLYTIIANAIINRDMSESERLWATAKKDAEAKLRKVSELSDTPFEDAKVAEASQNYAEIVRIYEQETLPLIMAGAQLPGPLADIDSRIDLQVDAFRFALEEFSRLHASESIVATEEFNSIVNHSISLGLAISLIVIALAISISILTTRWIVRPFSEVTRAAIEMENGNYDVKLEYRSDDEAGVLANAFRSMAEQVEKRTAELLESKRHLEHEVNERKLVEGRLKKAYDDLDSKVKERTSELFNANKLLELEISMHKGAEVALEEANEELRQMPSKLMAVQEEERKRLASELHDSIGQTLAALKFWVQKALKLRDEGDYTAALDTVEQFVPMLRRSIEETRNIYMGLHPMMLEDIGLQASLEWLKVECMRLFPQQHIDLETEIAEEEIPENLKLSLFRIVQEALNNIAKHSKAELINISLLSDAEGIELVIFDNGVGIDLEEILHRGTAKGLGLVSMRERAEFTGGKFSIASTPGEGTQIRVHWPAAMYFANK